MIALAILLLCILAFLFEDMWILTNFAMIAGLFFTEPWRAVTSMFLHADFAHLFLNMFALLMFGTFLERKVGSKWFIIIYFSAGILGALGFELLSEPGSAAIGASGAIYGIIGALVVLAPRMVVYIFGVVPMPMYVAGIAYVLLELVGLGRVDNIAHSAHLLGLVGGFVVAKIYQEITGGGRW